MNMGHPLLTAVVLGAGTGVAAAAGGLIEDHSVSIPTVCSVIGIVGTGAWWMAWKFKGITTRLDAKKIKLEELGEKLQAVSEAIQRGSIDLAKLSQHLQDLPCVGLSREECRETIERRRHR